jgi:hypothetical protein
MSYIYRRAQNLIAGEVAGPNKGVFLNVPGATAADYVFHVISEPNDNSTNANMNTGIPGTTGDIKISVPAGESKIVPIQIFSLHTLPADGEATADLPTAHKLN